MERVGLAMNGHRPDTASGLAVPSDEQRLDHIAVDDDASAIVLRAPGSAWSGDTLVWLAECAVPVVLCNADDVPISCIWPLDHGGHAATMRAQMSADSQLKRRLWQQLTAAKIRMQGQVLSANGGESGSFRLLADMLRRGDPLDFEARAARRYRRLLFEREFSFEEAAGVEELLEFGRTRLRAVLLGAICAAGLHPAPGLSPAGRGDAFALADDLIQPYRPLVDQLVLNLARQHGPAPSPEARRALAALTALELSTPVGNLPLALQCRRLVRSLAEAFETGKAVLELPVAPSHAALREWGLV